MVIKVANITKINGKDVRDSAAVHMASLATIEANTTATTAHEIGSYFWLNEILYETTTAIAVGDTIIVGTNCKEAILGEDVADLKSQMVQQSNTFNAFAYAIEYITQFASGTYKWYSLALPNGTVLVLKTLDGSAYTNNELLLYSGYAGTQLGTIYPKINGDTATYTVDKDNVTYIRTGATWPKATLVYKSVDGFDAETKIERLNARENESITNIKHLFEFDFGDINGSGQVTTSKRRMATPTIQHYDFDIIIPKRDSYTLCALFRYGDGAASSPYFVGPINANHDYIIRAGMYFRLLIYNPDDISVITGDRYDNPVYNAFRAFNRNYCESYVHSGDNKANYLYNRNVRSVCHRGASRTAPENTLPAFIEARRYGFEWVEADVARTHDGVYVLLHDATIDRTSNGTGNISDLDYDDIKDLDFGSWFSPDGGVTYPYTGVKIPRLDEFLQLCRKIGLKARLDLNHAFTHEQIADVCGIVVRNGMKDYTEYVGYNVSTLETVKANIPTATLVLLASTVDATAVSNALSLKTDKNTVNITSQTNDSTAIGLCAAAQVPLEYWTAGNVAQIEALDPYITVVTVEDSYSGQALVAGYILYKSVIQY